MMMILSLKTDDGIFHLAEEWCLRAATSKAQWMIHLAEHFTTKATRLENIGWKKITGMTQTEKMIKHMRKTGSITQREAYLDYNVQSFHRRLSDLRDEGYPIVGVTKTHPTSAQKYTRYYLKDEGTAQLELNF